VGRASSYLLQARTRAMAPSIPKEAPVVATKESEDSLSLLAQAALPRRKSTDSQEKPRSLAEGIRTLRDSALLCDVLLFAGSESFPAHQAMLSAMSPELGSHIREAKAMPEAKPSGEVADAKDGSSMPLGLLSRVVEPPPADGANGPSEVPTPPAATVAGEEKQVSYESIARAALGGTEAGSDVAAAVVDAASTEVSTSEQRLKIRVNGILHAESVKIMLDYIYQVGTGNAWEYSPSSLDVNKEVLKLSRQFRLNHLQEYAARWLTRGLNTKNLVERLVICEEFKLGMLREKLIEQLTANPAELGVVCRSTEVLAHPTILQDLLVQVSSLCGMTGWQPHRSSPQKREAPEESTEEKVPEKIAEEEKTEKAPEKLSTKVDKPLEKNTEDERPEKLKPDKDKTEKTSAKASVKVPPLKKKRTQ